MVVAGADTYGAVRKVGTTPIVTRFAMLQHIPLFPLESYYITRLGTESMAGIPLMMARFSRPILGLRLAQVDRLSVAITYVRAVAVIFLLVGLMVIAMIVGASAGPQNQNDPFQKYFLPISLGLIAASVVIGLPSYLATYIVPDRDRRIREICGQFLSIAADPANIERSAAEGLLSYVQELMASSGIADPSALIRNPAQASLDQMPLLLLTCRILIALRGDRDTLEKATDTFLLVRRD